MKYFSNFISGQLTEAAILWILYYITMRLFGFPYPELIATIIALFSFVPFFGPIAAMFIGAVLILSKGRIISSLVYDLFSNIITIRR